MTDWFYAKCLICLKQLLAAQPLILMTKDHF